jgi:hypothetical protein
MPRKRNENLLNPNRSTKENAAPAQRPSVINPNLTPEQIAERVRQLDASYEKARREYERSKQQS